MFKIIKLILKKGNFFYLCVFNNISSSVHKVFK